MNEKIYMFAVLVCSWVGIARADVVILGPPVAPAPAQVSGGQGLAVTYSPSSDPSTEFGFTGGGAFGARVNAILETRPNARSQELTPLDRSNNNLRGLLSSVGDFVAAVPGCPDPGCPFEGAPGSEPYSSTSAWAEGYRGYLVVTPDLAGQEVHLAVYGDDGFSVTVCDRDACQLLFERALSIGATTWRYSRGLKFPAAGLYSVIVAYAEVTEHAALELSYRVGPFQDVADLASRTPSFRGAGFTLLGPERFVSTEDGRAPVQSAFCPISDRGRVSASCPSNSYCDRAAVCAPCTTADACGAACQPCGPGNTDCAVQGDGYACNYAVPTTGGCSVGGNRGSPWFLGLALLATVGLLYRRRAGAGLILLACLAGVSGCAGWQARRTALKAQRCADARQLLSRADQPSLAAMDSPIVELRHSVEAKRRFLRDSYRTVASRCRTVPSQGVQSAAGAAGEGAIRPTSTANAAASHPAAAPIQVPTQTAGVSDAVLPTVPAGAPGDGVSFPTSTDDGRPSDQHVPNR